MKTPTSSRFPVLDNKPIDQWKVTELKEELKRRKLTTGGLKNDLVRRLDEALRAEMDTAPENEDNDGKGNENGEPESVLPNAGFPVVGESTIDNAGMSVEGNVGDAGVNIVSMGEGKSEEQQSRLISDPAAPGEGLEIDFGEQNVGLVSDPAAPEVGVETTIDEAGEGLVSDPAAPEVGVETTIDRPCEGLVSDSAAPEVGGLSGTDVTSALQGGNVSEGLSIDNALGTDGLLVDSTEKENGDSKAQQHPEDILPSNEDVKPDSSVPISQVSEVSSSLGFTVKSNNSISTDSVSIIEKNDLKDNIIADNVKLESDLKPEMVQPPSNDLVTVGGQLHPTDVDEPHENKVSVEETDSTLANADMSQKNYSADLGSPEKLNLDRSSGDDSMEEDALESKQIDSNYNPEVGEKNEQIEITANKEEIPVETMDTDIPVEVKDLRDEKNSAVVTSSDKRKLSDQEAVVNNKPAKRQHRWKTDSNNVSDPHVSIVSPSTPASDVPQFAVAKRNFSRSDSKGANDPPQEREVPPSAKPATNSLRIDNFLRPFTLKAVQELLGKTGNVTSFWMDHIKTHCYITYSSVEEATETRNAVYNLQWPPNGGRQLVAEFVDVEEVKLRLEPPPAAPVTPVPATPVTPVPAKAPEPATIPQPSPRQRLGQRMTEQRELPPPPPMLNRAPPPPPPQIEKVEAPLVTLDDLFRKTKATPRIYYLPLTEEQVAARRKSSEQ